MSSQMGEIETKFHDALKQIQTTRYSTLVNLASGFAMFVRLVRGTSEYTTILEALKHDTVLGYDLFFGKAGIFLRRLSIKEFDRAFSNPNDEAMSVVSIALLDAGADKQSIFDIVKDAEMCWWLPQILAKSISLPSN